jgi:hypothetical protein
MSGLHVDHPQPSPPRGQRAVWQVSLTIYAGRVEVVRSGMGRSCAAVNQLRESGQRRRETAPEDVEEARLWRAKGNSARNGENRKARSPRRLRTCGRGAALTNRVGRTSKKRLAPQVGLEPTTLRLTAECSTIELLRSGQAAFIITSEGVRACQFPPRCIPAKVHGGGTIERLGVRVGHSVMTGGRHSRKVFTSMVAAAVATWPTPWAVSRYSVVRAGRTSIQRDSDGFRSPTGGETATVAAFSTP